MMGTNMAATRGRRGRVRVSIFVALYMILLLSLFQCVLVLFLYGIGEVDGTMTPSLILGLIASFLSVPFVALHTFLSWQYKKMRGFNIPRTPLHTACSHLPRIMIVLWLAASVAGLVVMSKQPTCHSTLAHYQLWQAGISCQLHRAAVVIAVLAFVIACALFFSFQVCGRPYDVSLLGLYAPQRPPRVGSILSESSWESETLKHEIFYLCRHPDAGPGNGELYWSPNDSSLFEQPVRPPSIRYPGPARPRPQLRVNTNPGSIRPEIASSPVDSDAKVSSVDESKRSNSIKSAESPLSRKHSMASTLQLGTETAFTRSRIPEVPENPDIPEIPAEVKHRRQKSSVSSRRFLPKAWTLYLPLSEDPQIRALSSPPLSSESDSDAQSREETTSSLTSILGTTIASSPPPVPEVKTTQSANLSVSELLTPRRRSISTPGDPPIVLPPVPLVVRKSRSSYIKPTSRSIHHPHHPNYTPAPETSLTPAPATVRHSHNHPQTSDGRIQHRNTTRPIRSQPNIHQSHFHPSRVDPFYSSPRHITQSQHFRHPPPHHHRHSQQPIYLRRFDPARTLPPISHSDEVAIVYPSTRRPRSRTYGGISSMAEIGGNRNAARTSLNLASGIMALEADQDIETNTYRGAERTSMYGLG